MSTIYIAICSKEELEQNWEIIKGKVWNAHMVQGFLDVWPKHSMELVLYSNGWLGVSVVKPEWHNSKLNTYVTLDEIIALSLLQGVEE